MRSMVCSGDKEMEMGPPRSKPLHNFDLPCLKWGNRRYLTCKKLDDASNATATAASGVSDQYQHCRRRGFVQRSRSPPSKVESLVVGGMRRRESELSSSSSKNTDCAREQRLRIPKGEPAAAGIEAVREKIMKDLKTAADEIKVAIFRDEVSGDGDADDDEENFKEPKNKQKLKEKEREESPAVEVEQRPWNLRTRRAACKAPIDGEVTNYNYSSPMKNDVFRSPRVRDNGPSLESASAAADKKRPRPKFSVALSKKEIEEDFMAMVGHHRPPRRPKKRTRNVQKQLDYLFPGLWLTEVTVDSYKVPELVENGKR